MFEIADAVSCVVSPLAVFGVVEALLALVSFKADSVEYVVIASGSGEDLLVVEAVFAIIVPVKDEAVETSIAVDPIEDVAVAVETTVDVGTIRDGAVAVGAGVVAETIRGGVAAAEAVLVIDSIKDGVLAVVAVVAADSVKS